MRSQVRILGKNYCLLLGLLILTMLACTQSTPVPTERQEELPSNTQQQDELSIGEPTQFRVFMPEVSRGENDGEQNDQTATEFDPHVIIEVERTELVLGEMLTIVGRPVQIGKPYYSLSVRDEGVQDEQLLAYVSYENEVVQASGTSQILEIVSAQANMTQVDFVLHATGIGVTTVTIVASGEIHVGYPGPEMIVGDGSGSVLITVTKR